ncbi:MAG: hypothetical protein JOZ83_17745 [Silvibacterium sp.]|nr:hypothetical protein [Silvibacterium sp.]
MPEPKLFRLAIGAALLIIAGCRSNNVDQGAFKSAINDYYRGRQVCLWSAPIKLPAQADTSNDQQTKGFDALTDAGMLTRTSEEKKRFLIGSKQVNDYDLSEKGRSAWTPDSSEPGYGNFCFGHREVTTVDGFTPPETNATQYTVNYHSTVSGVPDWASSAEMKTAFPSLAAATSGQQTGTATLVKSNNGWEVTAAQPANPAAPPSSE